MEIEIIKSSPCKCNWNYNRVGEIHKIYRTDWVLKMHCVTNYWLPLFDSWVCFEDVKVSSGGILTDY